MADEVDYDLSMFTLRLHFAYLFIFYLINFSFSLLHIPALYFFNSLDRMSFNGRIQSIKIQFTTSVINFPLHLSVNTSFYIFFAFGLIKLLFIPGAIHSSFSSVYVGFSYTIIFPVWAFYPSPSITYTFIFYYSLTIGY